MKIKNIQLKSIEARRYTELHQKPKQIRIDHNSQVTQMQSKPNNQAIIDFSYTASYGAVGMIKLEGSLVYENDDAVKVTKPPSAHIRSGTQCARAYQKKSFAAW